MFLQTWVLFPGPTRPIMTVYNSGGFAFFWSPKAAGTDRHAGKAPLCKKGGGRGEEEEEEEEKEEEEDSTGKVNCEIVAKDSQLDSGNDHN